MSGDVGGMPAGSVIITPTDMYSEIRTMTKTLDHLVSVVDPALTTLRDDIATTRAKLRDDVALVRVTQQDHEIRLRSLDKRVWIAAVIAAGSGAGITQIISAFGG